MAASSQQRGLQGSPAPSRTCGQSPRVVVRAGWSHQMDAAHRWAWLQVRAAPPLPEQSWPNPRQMKVQEHREHQGRREAKCRSQHCSYCSRFLVDSSYCATPQAPPDRYFVHSRQRNTRWPRCAQGTRQRVAAIAPHIHRHRPTCLCHHCRHHLHLVCRFCRPMMSQSARHRQLAHSCSTPFDCPHRHSTLLKGVTLLKGAPRLCLHLRRCPMHPCSRPPIAHSRPTLAHAQAEPAIEPNGQLALGALAAHPSV
mmetsp:Transcript_31834/g.52603  ORF Transcript_31834/g.52603 Transcript_31834/m.52603 type:complete len:254 (+) Transcript_31834:543-1304(+)